MEFIELKLVSDKILNLKSFLSRFIFVFSTYELETITLMDLDKCFKEVQNSNMSKLGEDGKPIYNEKGKVMKGPNYFKPNLRKFVA